MRSVQLAAHHRTVQQRSRPAAIRAIHRQMIDAWNKGSGRDFAAPFAEDAEFVVFEGTHLTGRDQLAAFTQHIFDTEGSRLHGEVKFVRFVNPDLAVMHGTVGTAMPGETEASPSRDSMQLFVVARHGRQWQVESCLNARRLLIERQPFWDQFESQPPDAQDRVAGLVQSLEQPTRS
jgi:uncharacterized protein (TIGR02246 family)